MQKFSNISESMVSKFSLGLDLHGVIDSLPEVFAFLSKAVVDAGGEVHILTGSKIEQAKEELKKIRKRFYDWMKDPSAFSE